MLVLEEAPDLEIPAGYKVLADLLTQQWEPK